ncbi:bifunctional adenosylcobinamide kinase/adenosylcobinamide-phosphate guanylyltransferase [Tropicimonas sp. IMCC34043]|uniref:bifunctional adenosylcobinamide kinase/adenosylcobinamide-phosphate guanylyltransferase n=1 Tax=Tropicimonas sp. IMCC34043 TaxID=2248760 RepID=UPI000E281AEF|nr:bifunctional adenosylcobinamide kinase/adenosylcobinamide-phosphate guanylyltransferase [Tropicimonas sp. IMCC34043]
MTPHLTLVIGGANSGKSARAEALTRTLSDSRIYLATAQAFDAEMAAKIAAHRAARGDGWQTIEAPEALAEALAGIAPGSAVLLDCLTMWLSNRLLAGADPAAELPALCAALSACPAPVVVVTNEVGAGIVPENALARRFRSVQGRVNQQIAANADLVVAVMAGLPLVLKGQLPAALSW